MILKRIRLVVSLLAAATVGATGLPSQASAATFVVINGDGASEGFNDPTAAAPVGGNPGATVGQQRLNAFQHAANIWGARLQSAVQIRVFATFDELSCGTFSGVLGQAGPDGVFRDFPGAPVTNTWYASALANARRGADLDVGQDDINATFNSNVGTPGCLSSSGWYYGYDGNPPSGDLDFVTVLLHELGHGLGFLSLVDLASGAKNGGFDDAYSRLLENHGATPPGYPAMSNAQRVTASKATGNLHWLGPNVMAGSGAITAGKVGNHVRMFAPNPAQPGSSVSHWDTALVPDQLMEPSYTVPIHNPAFDLLLLRDIGWITTAPPVVGARNDLIVDFNSLGLYQRLNNVTWQKINSLNPFLVGAGDLNGNDKDEAIASFSNGLWARYNNATWTRLTPTLPTVFGTGDVDNSGRDDLLADLPGASAGLYIFRNNTAWAKLSVWRAQAIALGDIDGGGRADAIIDFGANGLWVRYNDATFAKLHNTSPTFIATGDLDTNAKDDIAVDFGPGVGLYVRFNNATWAKVNNATTQGLATGNLDGTGPDELIADLGAAGLWVRYNNATWTKVNNSSPVRIAVGDFDSSGRKDLVADFGSSGLFVRYNNAASWTKINNSTTGGLATGAID